MSETTKGGKTIAAADEKNAERSAGVLDSTIKLVQVVCVVAGVVISALSFNGAREKEALAREAEAKTKEFELKKYFDERTDEAEKRQAEAAKPFLELRQELYLETVQVAGVLANPNDHSEEELKKAAARFRQLYVSELSLVEGLGVEQGMMTLAEAVQDKIVNFDDKQTAAYNLAHALRDSLVKSWGIQETLVDNPIH